MGDQRERKDQEESNIPSKQERQEDTDYPFELESSAMHMA